MTAAEPLAGEELERVHGALRTGQAGSRPGPGAARPRGRHGGGLAAPDRPDRCRRGGRLTQPRRGLFAGWSARRIGVSLSAAVLAGLMVGTSAFAASRAGGPLYETRLALEALALPADPDARVDAQLEQAQARLAEAVEAAGRGDDAATAAALDAYDRTIDQLASIEGAPAARALEAIRFHRSILLEVAANAPAAPPTAWTAPSPTAIASSWRWPRPDPGAGPAGRAAAARRRGPGRQAHRGTPTADPTAKPGKTDDPAATPKPARTPKPAATPRPTDTPEPAATADPTQKPGRTPPPRKTPDPGKPGTRTSGSRLRSRRGRPRPWLRSRVFMECSAGLRCPAMTGQMRLTVLGAGPAYTDREGASGACYLVSLGSTHLLLDLGQGSFPRIFRARPARGPGRGRGQPPPPGPLRGPRAAASLPALRARAVAADAGHRPVRSRRTARRAPRRTGLRGRGPGSRRRSARRRTGWLTWPWRVAW